MNVFILLKYHTDSILFGFDLDHEQQKLVVALAPFSQFAIGGSPPNLSIIGVIQNDLIIFSKDSHNTCASTLNQISMLVMCHHHDADF